MYSLYASFNEFYWNSFLIIWKIDSTFFHCVQLRLTPQYHSHKASSIFFVTSTEIFHMLAPDYHTCTFLAITCTNDMLQGKYYC